MLSKLRQSLPLAMLLAITFLTALSMTIVVPILPFVVQDHVHDAKDIALWVGVLEAVFSACALFSAPVLGALSDRIGRKPVLVVSLLGTAVGTALFGVGGGLWMLILSRIIDGTTAGDMPVAMAYLADITAPEDRAKQFGLVGAVGGVGFMFGPAALTALTALIAAVILPETLTAEKRSAKLEVESTHPLATLRDAFSHPDLRPLLIAISLAAIPFTFYVMNVSVLAKDAISWGPAQIGLLVSCIGVLDIVIQGGLLRVALNRFGEHGVALAGLIGQALGCALLALVGSLLPLPWLFMAGTLVFGSGQGITDPAVQGLMSRAVPDDEQGALAGGLHSIRSGIQMLVPLLGGWLYARAGQGVPYALGVGLLLAAIALIWPLLARARQLKAEPQAA
jgi:DHA1 family tetracycline resistance protein-like MFS transporter